MNALKIFGQYPLKGNVALSGSKNVATKLLVASLLSSQKCCLHNVPEIQDVEITKSLCERVGSEIQWDKKLKTILIQTKQIKNTSISQSFSGTNRIPILIMGALLGRTNKEITIPAVGGCQIGSRPINFHIDAIRAMGASIEVHIEDGKKVFVAHTKNGLRGCSITLPYPSVGATENCIFAACHAQGETIIYNAAIECEIMDVILFLQKLGVTIHVKGNRTIHVYETKKFFHTTHTIIPDRMEAASFGAAAIGSKGNVFVSGARYDHMIPFLNKIQEMGGGVRICDTGITFFYTRPLSGDLHIETNVHPGFMTDWQPPIVILLTQTRGCSTVHETVYENRFGYINTLQKMGANIEICQNCVGKTPCRFAHHHHNHSVIIKGPTPLRAKQLIIPDLRAGMAYVLAALIATGESIIFHSHLLDRGYDSLEQKLSALGAQVEKIDVKNPIFTK